MSFNIKLSANPAKFQTKAFEVGRDHLYTTKNGRFATSIHPLVSYNANTCSMLSLNGENNRSCLMHLAPEQQSLRTLGNGLEKSIETLREKMNNFEDTIRAVLVGGRDSKNTASFELFNEIANLLDKFGIPFSMICGKYDNVGNDNIVTCGDTVKIWNGSLKDLDIPNETTGEELREILEQNYEVVEFSPEVPVTYVDYTNLE